MSESLLQRLVDGQLRPIIDCGEPWAVQAAADISASARKSSWCELANHVLVNARAKPSKRWLAEAAALVAAIGVDEFVERMRAWLLMVAQPPPDARVSSKLFEGDNGTLLRGLIWASSELERAPVSAVGAAASACLVKRAGTGARSIKVAGGCIWCLATIGSDEAVFELTRIKWTTEYARPSDLIARHLDEIADARGVSRSSLELLGPVSPVGNALDLEAAMAGAARAFEDRELDSALEALLDAWRLAKAPSLAALIERLGIVIDRGLEPIADDSEEMTAQEFEAVAAHGRAADVARLLRCFPATARRRNEERARALSGFADDPRIAMAFAMFATRASGGFPPSLWNTLVRNADPRVLEPLANATFSESAVSDLCCRLRDNAATAIAARLRGKVAWTAADDKRVAALEALWGGVANRISGGHLHADDLLAGIYADPASDELRLIYADVLSEAGDPRGELIALQFIEQPSAEQRARIKELVRDNGVKWLGPLAKAVRKTKLVYRRGFPAEASLPKDPRRASNLIGRAEWATFEMLDVRESSFYGTALHSEFLLNPCLRSLLEVRGLFVDQLLVLLAHKAPLDLVRVEFTMHTADYDTESVDTVRQAMDACVSLPKLRFMRVRGLARPAKLQATKLGAAIEIVVEP